ncbi:hypothetical protein BV22DRAFT_1048472 [Leucogyrophana mollusca]|uniref:Uncharacterized protein n=1 Tax=Leucogyrophana mollusca TaxID=85980 RepID=A0ACB8BBI6_9AGAM|nr:hypothetical protein BV22DRAFT_1048472 [Leucogyrophana mollusca]
MSDGKACGWSSQRMVFDTSPFGAAGSRPDSNLRGSKHSSVADTLSSQQCASKTQRSSLFFGHLITVLRRLDHRFQGAGTLGGAEPTESFAFGLEQRLECQACKRVRYRVDNMDALSLGVPAIKVPEDKDHDGRGKAKYAQCLRDAGMPGYAPGPRWRGIARVSVRAEGRCRKTNAVRKTETQSATFPEVLVLHAKKFQLVARVPTKLGVSMPTPTQPAPVLTESTPDSPASPGCNPRPRYASSASSSPGSGSTGIFIEPKTSRLERRVQFDADAMAQLEGTGFPAVGRQNALLATGNAGAEVAMEWLFGYMEDLEGMKVEVSLDVDLVYAVMV